MGVSPAQPGRPGAPAPEQEGAGDEQVARVGQHFEGGGTSPIAREAGEESADAATVVEQAGIKFPRSRSIMLDVCG